MDFKGVLLKIITRVEGPGMGRRTPTLFFFRIFNSSVESSVHKDTVASFTVMAGLGL